MPGIDNRLVVYIEANLARGVNPQTLKHTLLLHGWRQDDIDFAMATAQAVPHPTATDLSVKPKVMIHVWFWPLALAIVVYLLAQIYLYFYSKGFVLNNLSIGFAGAAAFSIGISFVLAPFNYFSDFLEKLMASRRSFGLVGYLLALGYSISLVFIDKDRYLFGFFDNLKTWDFILGLSAMGILTVMALVSNNWSIRTLGVSKWKAILRLGYLAYFLLVVRAIVMEGDTWAAWIRDPGGLPPIKWLVASFAIYVILLRIFMSIAMHFKKTDQAK